MVQRWPYSVETEEALKPVIYGAIEEWCASGQRKELLEQTSRQVTMRGVWAFIPTPKSSKLWSVCAGRGFQLAAHCC